MFSVRFTPKLEGKGMSKETIGLSELPRRLRKEFGVVITYRHAYKDVLDGTIPAERDETGTRWKIKVDDLPEIAKALKPINVEDLAPPSLEGKFFI